MPASSLRTLLRIASIDFLNLVQRYSTYSRYSLLRIKMTSLALALSSIGRRAESKYSSLQRWRGNGRPLPLDHLILGITGRDGCHMSFPKHRVRENDEMPESASGKCLDLNAVTGFVLKAVGAQGKSRNAK